MTLLDDGRRRDPMDVIQGMSGAVLVADGGFALPIGQVEQPGIDRTSLLQHDLSISGREVIQVRVDFEPGSASARHSHSGDEIVYVLEGALAYEIQGQPATVLGTGEALFIPAGTNHVARNVGRGKASQVTTYLARKGRPLLILARSPGRVARPHHNHHQKDPP